MPEATVVVAPKTNDTSTSTEVISELEKLTVAGKPSVGIELF